MADSEIQEEEKQQQAPEPKRSGLKFWKRRKNAKDKKEKKEKPDDAVKLGCGGLFRKKRATSDDAPKEKPQKKKSGKGTVQDDTQEVRLDEYNPPEAADSTRQQRTSYHSGGLEFSAKSSNSRSSTSSRSSAASDKKQKQQDASSSVKEEMQLQQQDETGAADIDGAGCRSSASEQPSPAAEQQLQTQDANGDRAEQQDIASSEQGEMPERENDIRVAGDVGNRDAADSNGDDRLQGSEGRETDAQLAANGESEEPVWVKLETDKGDIEMGEGAVGELHVEKREEMEAGSDREEEKEAGDAEAAVTEVVGREVEDDDEVAEDSEEEKAGGGAQDVEQPDGNSAVRCEAGEEQVQEGGKEEDLREEKVEESSKQESNEQESNKQKSNEQESNEQESNEQESNEQESNEQETTVNKENLEEEEVDAEKREDEADELEEDQAKEASANLEKQEEAAEEARLERQPQEGGLPGVKIEDSPQSEMWGNIVRNSLVGTGVFARAAICSLESGGILAHDPPEFTPTMEQVRALRDNFSNRSVFSAAGFGLGDSVFELQEETGTQQVMSGADLHNSEGALITKSNTAMLLGVYTDKYDAAMQLANDMREHFVSQNL